MTSALAVTLLYVPADRPDRVRKALDAGADVVIVDLEDAVAPESKQTAREQLPALLDVRGDQRVQVRVNGLHTPWGRDDLAMVAGLPSDIELRIPKVESPATVSAVLDLLGAPRATHCLVETAVGVEHAFDIARCAPEVATVALGEQDLASELGISDETGLAWVRGRLVVAAAAARLPPPAQSVYPAVRDLDGLAASCRRGHALGLVGRCAIHPAQLPVIRAAFRPETEEVRRARELVSRLSDAEAEGSGVTTLSDGSFVDVAMVQGARRVLELAELTAEPGT